MTQEPRCHLCDQPLSPEGHYIIRIEVFADPTIPSTPSAALEQADLHKEMAKLIEQMKDMTPDQLQDDVHRRFEYHVCRPCQRRFLANPLGQPRERRVAQN